jgi:RNA-binding protein YhbY
LIEKCRARLKELENENLSLKSQRNDAENKLRSFVSNNLCKDSLLKELRNRLKEDSVVKVKFDDLRKEFEKIKTENVSKATRIRSLVTQLEHLRTLDKNKINHEEQDFEKALKASLNNSNSKEDLYKTITKNILNIDYEKLCSC